ncbi:hypothetical protein GCM10028807_17490 [Spirosoma daeguense]
MLTIEFAGKSYQLPERWSEVKPDVLPQLLQRVYLAPGGADSYHETLQLALNIKPKAWQKLMYKHFGKHVGKKTRQANAIVLHTLWHQLRWMQTEPIHQQPFKSLDIGQPWLLPDADFLAMSYGELTDAYIHFLVYIRQLVAGDKHLDLLVATLCRPERPGDYQNAPGWNGDHREPYNEYVAKERAKSLEHLEPGYKMAVLLFFAGNMQRLMDKYEVFGKGESDGEPELYPGQSLTKNSHLLASKGIFGTLDQTKAANVHEVFLYLEEHRKDLIAEAERRNQQDE